MKITAKNIKAGQRIVIPNYRHDDDCRETGVVHNVTTRNVGMMGEMTLFAFGPGTQPVEVPSDRRVDVVDSITSTQKAAATMGRKGGKSKSDAKTRAARENGRRGGRPRKRGQQP